jgi:hypothetical protein
MPERSQQKPTVARAKASAEEPIKVCLLGATGAGKTCFLAGLAVLAEPDRKSIIDVLHDNKGTADYLDSLQDTLRSGHWPPPNNATFILDMTVMVENRAIDLRVVDYPGEDFTGALRTLDTREIEELYHFSRQAQIYLLLFSPHRDLAGSDSEEITTTLLARQKAHLQAIAQVSKERAVGGPQGQERTRAIELGLVITQCDRVPGLTNPRAARDFFKARAPNLVGRLTKLADRADFFGISVLGKPADGDGSRVAIENAPPPSRLDPYGYEPLFRWIRDYPDRHRWRILRPWVVGAAVAASLLLAGVYAAYKTNADHVRAVIAGDRPAVERIEETSGWFLDPTSRQLRNDLIRDTLQRLTDEVGRANTPDEFDLLGKEVERLAKADTATFYAQVAELQRNLTARNRHVLFTALDEDFQSRPRPLDFQGRASAFVDRYQSGDEVNRVREMLRAIRREEASAHRARLKGMPTRDSLDVAAKSRQILQFVSDYEDILKPDEARAMRRAADLARAFSERGNWTVTIKKSGGLTAEYAQSVLLGRKKLGESDVHVFDGESTGETKDKVWATEPAIIRWQAGEPLAVTLKFEGYVNDGWVAYQIDESSLAIGSLVGRRKLAVRPGWESYVRDPYVEFQVENLTPADWETVKAYVSPGSAW